MRRSTATSPPSTSGSRSERVAAFSEFVADVRSGAYPEPKHIVGVAEEELAKFRKELAALGA